MTLLKNDIVEKMYGEKKGYLKGDLRRMWDDLFEIIASSLENGDKIVVREFGTFETKTVKGHAAVHPVTGERFEVKDYKNVIFHPAKELRRKVREVDI